MAESAAGLSDDRPGETVAPNDGSTPDDGLPDDRRPEECLAVSVDGFEGPIDLLLTLARAQKVDLRHVSVRQLAEQYLEFVAEARRQRIELAADYLVMAAWLAYLKSRLLLPPPAAEDGPSADDLAARLAWQLQRLEAIRKVAAQLMARDQLGRDHFARGTPEPVTVNRRVDWQASQSDLLRAYARIRTREEYTPLHVRRPAVFTVEAAVARLRAVIGASVEWGVLMAYMPEGWGQEPQRRRSAVAATFAASLELAKRGEIELRQEENFAPIMVRRAAERAVDRAEEEAA